MANVGTIDRGLRFAAGAVLMVAPFVPQAAGLFAGMGDWKYAVVAAGAVMFGTAVFRFCPAYTLFGIRTCEIGTRRSSETLLWIRARIFDGRINAQEFSQCRR